MKMKGFIKCSMLIMLFSVGVLNVKSQQLLDVNVFLDLARLVSGLGNLLTFGQLFQESAPILATRPIIGLNLTILLFPDKTPVTSEPTPEPTTTLGTWTRSLTGSPAESAKLIQEHTFTPAMKMEELLEKGTVTNVNGNKVVFERNGDQVTANGHLVTEKNIPLGDYAIAHRIAEPLPMQDLPEREILTARATNATFPSIVELILQIPFLGPLLLKPIIQVIQALLPGSLTTFVAPDQTQSEVLTKSYSPPGIQLFTPLLENYVQKYTFPGSYSPHELMQMNEITNVSGEKMQITKLDDGNLKIGDCKVYMDKATEAKDGYFYNY